LLISDDDDGSSTAPTATAQPTDPPATTDAAIATTEPPATTEAIIETTEAPATTDAAVATTEPPETTVAAIAEPRCGYLGVDDFDDMQVEVDFINPLGTLPAVEVSFALLDGSGTRFHTDSESFDLPQVDERVRSEVDTVTGLPADVDGASVSCQILDISEGFGYDDVLPPPASSACEIVEIDEFGDIQVVLTTTSPFDTIETLEIYYALRGEGGARFADSYASVEFVGSQEALRIAEDTVTEVPSWTTEQDLSCDILGIRASEF
jgi:hypothetical protein